MHLARHGLAPPLRVLHPVDGEERRLGLDVVHVLRVLDAGVLHRRLHALGDDLDHARAADVLGLKLRAHGRADHQARLVRRSFPVIPREHGRVGRDDAVAAPGPHHRDRRDLGFAALAVLHQHAPESVIGQQAGEVVDPAVALGLSDDRHDLIGGELSRQDALLEARAILDALELDLRDFDGHRLRLLFQSSGRGSTLIPPSTEKSMRRTVPGAPA